MFLIDSGCSIPRTRQPYPSCTCSSASSYRPHRPQSPNATSQRYCSRHGTQQRRPRRRRGGSERNPVTPGRGRQRSILHTREWYQLGVQHRPPSRGLTRSYARKQEFTKSLASSLSSFLPSQSNCFIAAFREKPNKDRAANTYPKTTDTKKKRLCVYFVFAVLACSHKIQHIRRRSWDKKKKDASPS